MRNLCHAAVMMLALAAVQGGQAVGQVVINEIDYDQPGTDTREFVELKNTGACTASLEGLALVFVNGATNLEYRRVALSGTLAPGQYLVVAAPGVAVPPEARVIAFAAPTNDSIQNGSPDGVLLVDVAATRVIDSLSYEGSITAAVVTGFPPLNLVNGTALPGVVVDSNTLGGSLGRVIDGSDTNDDTTDWGFALAITPGLPNSTDVAPLIACCGSADFNNDVDVGTDADIEAFFACLAGNCCAACQTADFNVDGDVGTDADIESFFRVLAGGNC